MKLCTRIFTVFILILGIISCSKSNTNNSVSTTITLEHPKDTLRIGNGDEPPSLDPQHSGDTVSSRIIYDLFENLLDFDQANHPIAGMAESWTISPDKKHYVFHLRKDLKFSDGNPITANDFVYTWRRVVDPQTATDRNITLNSVLNARAIMKGQMDKSKMGVSAPDSYTFDVILSRPDPTILYAASGADTSVVSQRNIEKYGNKWTEPGKMVSSGAYMLSEHINNGKVVIIKNPYYYAKNTVKIPRVEFYPISNQDSEMAQYK